MRRLLLGWLVWGLACGAALAQSAEKLVLATGRAGVTQPVLLVTPAGAWDHAVILFIGSGGKAHIAAAPVTYRGDNTLFRGLDRLVARGLAAAVLDPPSDRSDLWNYRTSQEHAQDVAVIIAALRARGAHSVWLAGISMGSLSAASIAVRLKAGGPDGIILLSSVVKTSRRSTESILDVPLEAITVPVLVVRNPRDECPSSPPAGADSILARLTQAPVHRLLEFTGDAEDQSDVCEALSAHGFLGLDEQLMAAVAGFIRAPS